MRTRRQFIQALSSLPIGAVMSGGLGGGAQAEAFAGNGFVKATGADLVDPAGKKLFLRGINLGNWMEPEGYMFLFDGGPQSPREIEAFFNEMIGPHGAAEFWREYRRQYITQADIEFIARTGMNSVRVPLHYKFFVSGEEGFGLLDQVLAWCRSSKLWAILDMHCAPGGQTGTNIDDSWGYPWLYESAEAQQQICEIWGRIAQRYSHEPVVLGYDLLNEPIPHFPQLRKYNEKLEPLYRRITQAIRAADKNHVIIYGGAQWDSNFKVFGEPFDSNAVYQFHKYWMTPNQDSIQEYLDFRKRYNVPIWLGESGENTDEWIHEFTAMLEKNNVGWCYWPYKKMEKSSCMVSVVKPVFWDELSGFAKLAAGTGNAEKRIASRPTVEQSRQAMNDLLLKIRWSACRINSSYIRAMGLRV